jgi:MFS family permease
MWAPLSDRGGRRIILILSQICNIIGCIICFLSPNVYVFLVGRIVASGGSGAGLTVGAGVVADVYSREERGRAFGVFYLGWFSPWTNRWTWLTRNPMQDRSLDP